MNSSEWRVVLPFNGHTSGWDATRKGSPSLLVVRKPTGLSTKDKKGGSDLLLVGMLHLREAQPFW